MIISCPSCATRFTVGATSIPPAGRKVRCAQCGNTWHQFPEDEGAVETRLLDDAPRTMVYGSMPSMPVDEPRPDIEDTQPPAKRKRARPPLGWMALAATVVVCAGGLTLGRGLLVEMWPPAFLLYETIGMAPEAPGTGLRLSPPKAEIKVRDGVQTLVLEGQILNPSGGERVIPTLRAIPTAPDGKLMESWTLEPSLKSLQPGEIAAYRDERMLSSPVAEVTVTF